jgi:16S rRNA (guanine1207-N2)-methyltransferase
LDPATAALLETCAPRAGDRVLDLGCGTGVVAAALLAEGLVAEATLTDSDALALETSRRTLALNGLEAELVASDAGAELPAKRYDLILTNPPLHRGFARDRGTPARIVDEAVRLLAPKGRLHLVGPPTLRLGAMLEARFKRVEVLSARPAFQVWRASRPLPPRALPGRSALP